MSAGHPCHLPPPAAALLSLLAGTTAQAQVIRCDPVDSDTGLINGNLPAAILTLDPVRRTATTQQGSVWALSIEPNHYTLRRADPQGPAVIRIDRNTGTAAFVYQGGATVLRLSCRPSAKL